MAIEKRGNKYRARLRLDGQPEVSKTFATRKAAQEWHRQMVDAAGLGTLAEVIASDRTFGEVLRIYADKVTPHKRGEKQELHRVGMLLRSKLANLKLSAFTRRELRGYRDERLKSVKGSTWTLDHSLICQVLKFARRELDCKLDVADIVEGLGGGASTRREGRIRPDDEAALLAGAAAGASWAPAMVRLSLALGTRRTELWALRHEDIDRNNLTVHIRGTKTEGSDRVLPISPATLAVIDSVVRNLGDQRVFWQAKNPDTLTEQWRQAARRAGRSHIVMHLARHECLSRLSEMPDVDLLKLAAYSGHKSLKMLARYARPDATLLRRLVA